MTENDLNTALFRTLKKAAGADITGGVYIAERPDGSGKEDIVVNCLSLSQYPPPQRGTSNVNIHVPDITARISGQTVRRANDARIEELTTIAVKAIKAMTVEGAQHYISSVTTMREANGSEHYANIRISWHIPKFDYYEQ